MKLETLHKADGIILKSIDYGDYDKILTVFTASEGVVSLIVKGARRQGKHGAMPLSPLLEAEFLYAPKTSGSLFRCKEITPKNHFLFLREEIEKLEAACNMAMAISRTQLPCQPAPLLFQLLRCYIQQLKECPAPQNILSSFRLKLLRHEGLLMLPVRCSVCDKEVGSFNSFGNECYCPDHAPEGSLSFSLTEVHSMALLAHSRNFSEIEKCPLSLLLHNKITAFFQNHSSGSFL